MTRETSSRNPPLEGRCDHCGGTASEPAGKVLRVRESLGSLCGRRSGDQVPALQAHGDRAGRCQGGIHRLS